MIKPYEEMTPHDYHQLGLKAGLEIHQQLFTDKKLFCRCKAGEYSEKYDAEILRHMRPTLSELGEYDGTALMEFKTKKEIVYQLNTNTVCTYEMDDAPPFELNRQALDNGLEITMLLNCNVVSEIHIARKQYLDGSIPTGFQRTTILGIEGEIRYKNRTIGIIQLGLEEDACREVSDNGHIRTYKTDRLGMPLIEIVTYPDMRTPQEVAGVCQILRQLTHMTGKVRRGIGAGRQDVNVSIEGGTRIEIKGVPRIPLIPLLVHNEAGRQKALLEIKDKLNQRGISHDSFKADFYDVTETLKNTVYQPIQNSWNEQFKVSCVRLNKFKGILRHPTQPDTNFAKEISDRVRVVACLDKIPNIIHSDSDDVTIGSTNWTKIRKLSQATPDDALVIVWGNPQDVQTAEKEIALRAREAIDGVPSETRQALSDGNNGFERILPGADRMYPDTDLPPIALTSDHLKRIQQNLPELPWERVDRYQKSGLSEHLIRELLVSPFSNMFDIAIKKYNVLPSYTAHIFTALFKHWKRSGHNPGKFSENAILEPFKKHSEKQLAKEAIPILLEELVKNGNPTSQFTPIKDREHERVIHDIISKISLTELRDKNQIYDFLMGKVMSQLRGRIDGKIIAYYVKKVMDELSLV